MGGCLRGCHQVQGKRIASPCLKQLYLNFCLQSDVGEVEGGSMNNPDKVVSSINVLHDLETPLNNKIYDTLNVSVLEAIMNVLLELKS